jgi:DMSO/TMAO reductase YedYZ molybdopterin-dependent catalytic subunit
MVADFERCQELLSKMNEAIVSFITRRELLILSSAGRILGQGSPSSEPQNVSYPLAGIQGSVTPAELFFVRDHFREPELSLSTWRLKIEGKVTKPIELTLSDIIESPTKEVEAVLECAGNPAIGSAASNGVWEGVPLASLLQQAGAAKDAVAVMLEGADSGRLMQDSPELPYCQIVPMAKCNQPESLVAFKLNGGFLPRRNGFPARALFPGWYGMDSVKWLRRIVVLGPSDMAPNFQASGMNKLYNRIVKSSSGELKVTRTAEIQIRSVIAWPPDNQRLPARQCVVRGFAWTGGGLVRRVSVSCDGGHVWAPAQLESSPKQFTWVRWKYLWSPVAGEYVLMSRAVDDMGGEQPLTRDPSRKDGYELNFCAPVRCSVR